MGQSRLPALTLDYRLSEEIALDTSEWQRHVERWTITATGPGADPVGDARVIILNLAGGVEMSDLADAASGNWREPVRRTRGRRAHVLGDHVLLLDRVFVEPAHRGAGLGPVLAALGIGRLRRGCSVAVCFPSPFDGARPAVAHERSTAALGRIWATVGFRARPDGVWTLNLEDDTLRSATDRLLSAAGRADRPARPAGAQPGGGR